MGSRALIAFTVSFLLCIIGCIGKDDSPTLKGPYLGQKPPGKVAEIFAPGIISNPDSRDLMHGFFDRGRFFILHRYPVDFKGDWTKQPLVLMKQIKGKWTAPYASKLIGRPWFYNVESVPEGVQVIFAWTRNLDGSGPPRELYLWSSIKTQEGWADPVRLEAPVNTGFETWPSLDRDKILYFFSSRAGGMGGFDIYRSIPNNGVYREVQNLGGVINTRYTEEDPFIAPDGSYLLFDSNRPGGYGDFDLCIAWREEDGAWGRPVNLGDRINTKYAESRAYMTPDGKYLFFTSNRNGTMDTWWVDAIIVEELRQNALARKGAIGG